MVFNAGFWPNDDIAQKLGIILRSAKDVMGNHGRVLWKGLTPTRGEPVVHPSPSDLAAKEWSFRHPWLFYEAFNTTSSIINEEDYFDDKHFSNPHIYRQWNQGLNLNQSIVHRVFILVGGVRTFRQTQQSILHNLIYPVCAPPTCIAHLVIHLSSADNRPGNKEDDPGGRVLPADSNDEAGDFFFTLKDDLFPDGFLVVHKVDGYEIGSAEEQHAMDVMESEIDDPVVVHRLRVIRFGDTRRYSMWFARAWAWSLDKKKDIWVHALYYSDAADTFAFLPSLVAAETYFSLHNLVRKDVGCLGGPGLNQSVVAQVLSKKDITVELDLWCKREDLGWSEKILRRKLLNSGANIRYIHASAVILRPPSIPENKRPVRLRGSVREGQSNLCLSWNETSNALLPSPCEFPYPPMQLFFSFDDEWYGYIGITEIKRYETLPLNTTQVDSFLRTDEWITENVELYSLTSHEEKP
eukprot:scaffold2007_cov131-Skeletonema_menzelii.AAC.4